jgi:hypothetical protein
MPAGFQTEVTGDLAAIHDQTNQIPNSAASETIDRNTLMAIKIRASILGTSGFCNKIC